MCNCSVVAISFLYLVCSDSCPQVVLNLFKSCNSLTYFSFQFQYERYVPIRSPVSVREWLAHLNLHQYTELFMDSGWDHVKFLKDMTVEDLNEIGIGNRDHQVRILHSILCMKDLVSGVYCGCRTASKLLASYRSCEVGFSM